MASSLEYVQFVADQLSEAGVITYKRMFGEYGLYCDGKFFATVEDDQFYVKITEAGQAFMPEAVIASPHEGARYFLIEELDDKEFLRELTQRTCAQLPMPKPRTKKGHRQPMH